jgi:hypothetical protein
VPLVLLGALAAGNAVFFQREQGLRRAAGDADAARRDADERAGRAADEARAAKEMARGEQDELDKAKAALAAAEQRVAAAQRGDSEQLARAKGDLDAAKKRVALLEDQLGEMKARAAAAERKAGELESLVGALVKKKINVRRLAGLDPPPRVEAEVVSTDDKSVPPVLVMRLEDGVTGIGEGDVLYLARTREGKQAEAGRAVIERLERDRGLLSARITRLDPDEKVVVGDRLSTYPPGQ